MIQIATPISPLFENESNVQRISEASDCLEGRDRYSESPLQNQALFHFGNSLIWNWDKGYKEYVGSVIRARPGLRVASFHLNSPFHNPPVYDKRFMPKGRRYTRAELLENAETNTDWLKENLPQRVSIAVENNNFLNTEAYELVTDADFISEVTQRADVGFLLDIAHAKITAHNKDANYQDYVKALPMNRAVQMHLNRPYLSQTIAADIHDLPDDEASREAIDLCKKHGIEYVTFEYSDNADKLISGIQRFRELEVIA